MKNSNNVSNNVNLIFNTYKYLFIFTNCCRESLMLLDSFNQEESARYHGNKKVLESAAFKIHKSTMAKMIDMHNLNKLTGARSKMEVSKLQTSHEMMRPKSSIEAWANVRKTNIDVGI